MAVANKSIKELLTIIRGGNFITPSRRRFYRGYIKRTDLNEMLLELAETEAYRNNKSFAGTIDRLTRMNLEERSSERIGD